MNQNHRIYDIEPDSSLDQVKKLFSKISPEFSLYHIEIVGGNKNFYDVNGGKALKNFVDKLKEDLLEQEIGFYLMEVTSQFGDLYIITKEKPKVENLRILNESDKNLEVKLAVSEIKVE